MSRAGVLYTLPDVMPLISRKQETEKGTGRKEKKRKKEKKFIGARHVMLIPRDSHVLFTCEKVM